MPNCRCRELETLVLQYDKPGGDTNKEEGARQRYQFIGSSPSCRLRTSRQRKL
ncbi:unnamed protein product [Nesidiocoris tenuis]|uniref:Uncharacterized protein n=1 Tax=Nesidiocoris tenuis TaxID=355587 RepID=A0A6H5FWJ1_9HEMI|nr:unnamed protein product [Nesidiocoris tenuis]